MSSRKAFCAARSPINVAFAWEEESRQALKERLMRQWVYKLTLALGIWTTSRWYFWAAKTHVGIKHFPPLTLTIFKVQKEGKSGSNECFVGSTVQKGQTITWVMKLLEMPATPMKDLSNTCIWPTECVPIRPTDSSRLSEGGLSWAIFGLFYYYFF